VSTKHPKLVVLIEAPAAIRWTTQIERYFLKDWLLNPRIIIKMSTLCMANNLSELIPTRRTLLSRLKNWDDQESWQEFFNTYWKLIYGVATKAGLTKTEAQDVVQETVLIVAKKMPDFRYDPALGSFKQWLLRITRWRILDQLRKRPILDRRLGVVETVSQSSLDTATTELGEIEHVADPAGLNLAAMWEEEWAKNIFDTALEKVKREVSARQYQIFDLYVIKQWPVRKVARTLGINIAKVYLAKHRVAGSLKKEIQKLERAAF
jgi:RNA polymerase sigma factor (sigma-70 family)